ncbi:MAG: hypothetical protein Q8P95_03255 [bacterium]|nr:hypothetical protein [bacterium]
MTHRSLLITTIVLMSALALPLVLSNRSSEWKISDHLPGLLLSSEDQSTPDGFEVNSHRVARNYISQMAAVIEGYNRAFAQFGVRIAESDCKSALLAAIRADINAFQSQYQNLTVQLSRQFPILMQFLRDDIVRLQQAATSGTLIGGLVSKDRRIVTSVGLGSAAQNNYDVITQAYPIIFNSLHQQLNDMTCAQGRIEGFTMIPANELSLSLGGQTPGPGPNPNPNPNPGPQGGPGNGGSGTVTVATDGTAIVCPEVVELFPPVSGGSDGGTTTGTEPGPETEEPGMAEPEHPSAEEGESRGEQQVDF